MKKSKTQFLDSFPDHQFRYIDQTGLGRPPVSSATKRDDLNLAGYEAYFTVNGFADALNATKENCSSINAFFMDVDGRKDEKEIEAIKKKLDPTFILETGHGYHFYWVLDEPLYKDEMSEEDWEDTIARWEAIETSLVTTLNGDLKAKDLARIMRQPETFYWKQSGDAYKKGTDGVFKIKGLYKNIANSYSMTQVEAIFPPVEAKDVALTNRNKKFAESERKDFFDAVNQEYPIEERDSFRKLISGAPDTLPKGIKSRNEALLITASLMRQAGWSLDKAFKQIEKVKWHGIEEEHGWRQEIRATIASAFTRGYTYSFKNEIIAHNMSAEEQSKIQLAYVAVQKQRKEKDKVRFGTYEREILLRYPHLRKNDVGLVFDYKHGVYSLVPDLELEGIIYNALYEDMLWGFRTPMNVAAKIACLLSIMPELELTDDKGVIANVKNGLLNIYTRELKPHTPDFVSLVQFPVDYDPNALAPTWDRCLHSWMEGDEEDDKISLLQQYSGYCLSSSMLYDRALFLVGDGGNGKSTFVDTIAMVIGHEGTSHIDLEGLYGQYGMKGLIGKRLNIIEEVHGNYYQSNKLKKLISGEQVTIDIKYKDQFSFRPQAKFIFAVNGMPRMDDTSTATERRICAAIFLNNFRDNPNIALRSDTGLLAQELSGILNWMLEGARILKEKGNFIITKEQTKLLNEYRQDNSSVEAFISECLVFMEGRITSARELHDEYKRYCQNDGRKFKAGISFTKEMASYGKKYHKFTYMERSSGHSEARFEGVAVNPNWSRETKANYVYENDSKDEDF